MLVTQNQATWKMIKLEGTSIVETQQVNLMQHRCKCGWKNNSISELDASDNYQIWVTHFTYLVINLVRSLDYVLRWSNIQN
jgi:hypothetical protein